MKSITRTLIDFLVATVTIASTLLGLIGFVGYLIFMFGSAQHWGLGLLLMGIGVIGWIVLLLLEKLTEKWS